MERAQKLVRLVTEGSISQLLLFADDKITLVPPPNPFSPYRVALIDHVCLQYLSGKRCTLQTRLSDGSTLLHM